MVLRGPFSFREAAFADLNIAPPVPERSPEHFCCRGFSAEIGATGRL